MNYYMIIIFVFASFCFSSCRQEQSFKNTDGGSERIIIPLSSEIAKPAPVLSIFRNTSIRLNPSGERRVFLSIWADGKAIWSADASGKFTVSETYIYRESYVSSEMLDRCVFEIKKLNFDNHVIFIADVEPINIVIDDQNGYLRHLTSFSFDNYEMPFSESAVSDDLEKHAKTWKNAKELIMNILFLTVPTSRPVPYPTPDQRHENGGSDVETKEKAKNNLATD